jgi:GMP synthase (glutamine-hydrolysing)
MLKILVVQSRTTERGIARERDNFTRAAQGAAELAFLSALDESVAWTSPPEFLKDFSGVIFGGSSDFDFHGGRAAHDPARITSMAILARAKHIVTHAQAENLPILGVCFGHQMIAQMQGGQVSNDREQSKYGSYEVHRTEEGMHDVLFGKLPESFFAQYAHKDSVTNLPEGAKLLATGTACRFSALRYGDHIYTMQFHPEVERINSAARHQDSPEASRLLLLWIEHVVALD